MPKPANGGKELAVATDQQSSIVRTLQGVSVLVEALTANLGEGKLSVFKLPRLKIPAGGGTTFEFETPTGNVSAQELRGVVLRTQTARAMYKTAGAVEGTPPDCASTDGKAGYGDRGLPVDAATPGGPFACKHCPHAQFKTAVGADGKPGRGCKCKEREFQLVLLESGGMLPYFFNLPPTSVGASRAWRTNVAMTLGRYWHVLTSITLEKTQGDGVTYSRAVFRTIENLTPDQIASVDTYIDSLDEFLLSLTVEEAFVEPPPNGADTSTTSEPAPPAAPEPAPIAETPPA